MASRIGGVGSKATILVLVGLVAGCGLAAKINARNDMEASKTAYKVCLAQHPQDVEPCEASREAYQADLAAYQATSAGIRPGPTITVEQPTDYGLLPAPPARPMSIIVGPNGQPHPCLPMGPTMTVCN